MRKILTCEQNKEFHNAAALGLFNASMTTGNNGGESSGSIRNAGKRKPLISDNVFYNNAPQYGFKDVELRKDIAKELRIQNINDRVYFVFDPNATSFGKVMEDRPNRVILGPGGLNMKTIAHELTHVKQLLSGKLRIDNYGNTIFRYRAWETDRKSTRLNSSHSAKSRMPSSA